MPDPEIDATCVPVIPEGEFAWGVCVDPLDKECTAWTYNRFGTNCLVSLASGSSPIG